MTHRLLLTVFILLATFGNCITIPHYYATSADTNFFSRLMRLINSINTRDPHVEAIMVFDLGFTRAERKQLQRQPHVHLWKLEDRHPYQFKLMLTSNWGRRVRGSFIWKPIAIKIALERLPYVMYLDAGLEVLKPMDDIFAHIVEHGYFLTDAGHNIKDRVTKPVIDQVINTLTPEQQAVVYSEDTHMLNAGVQGLSRAYYESYVLPVYTYTTNMDLFRDDGSAPMGFGAGRHDQTVFSIHGALMGFKLCTQGYNDILLNGESKKIHIVWNRDLITEETIFIY